jgi:hypothetical protein
LALIFTWYIIAQAEPPLADKIRSPVKNVYSNEGKDYLSAQGRWKRTAGSVTLHNPSRINSTFITCTKDSMTCTEVTAKLVTPQEIPHFEKATLFADATTYQIVEWSNNIIHAKYLAHVADFELRISLMDKFIERRWRETKARGSTTSDPNNYEQWILE